LNQINGRNSISLCNGTSFKTGWTIGHILEPEPGRRTPYSFTYIVSSPAVFNLAHEQSSSSDPLHEKTSDSRQMKVIFFI